METLKKENADPLTVEAFENFLTHILPKAEKWYQWFETTQSGPLPNTFRFVDFWFNIQTPM